MNMQPDGADRSERGSADPGRGACSGERDSATPLLDPVALDRLRSLDPPGQSDTLRRIITLFFETAPPDFGELERALQAGDWPGARRMAHKLKSSAATVGATTLASVLGNLERAAARGAVDLPHEVAARLRVEFDRTCGALSRIAD